MISVFSFTNDYKAIIKHLLAVNIVLCFRYTFAWKVLSSAIVYLFVSPESSLLVAIFMITNRTVPQGTFYLFGLRLSDIIDHDNDVNKR